MPELPEVEHFRQLLLPLKSCTLQFTVIGDSPPRKWLTEEEVAMLKDGFCVDIIRRGKQICMIIKQEEQESRTSYLYLHMGMTGRISVPNRSAIRLENVKASEDGVFPPRYTYLLISGHSKSTANATKHHYEAAFSDSRKFGSCHLSDSLDIFNELAPDAHEQSDLERILPRLIGQAVGTKALLLDQKRALSGVGNWVADEVLYQSGLHPDQILLTEQEGRLLLTKLKRILEIAIDCLKEDKDYPADWLFGYRWTKKKAGKDAQGRSISFLTSGGRTTAIVASVQKLHPRKRVNNITKPRKRKINEEEQSVEHVLPSTESIEDQQTASVPHDHAAKPRGRRQTALLPSPSPLPSKVSSSSGEHIKTEIDRAKRKRKGKEESCHLDVTKPNRERGLQSSLEDRFPHSEELKDPPDELIRHRRTNGVQKGFVSTGGRRQGGGASTKSTLKSSGATATGPRRSPRFI